METRTEHQTKIYVLVLNPVTDRAESRRTCAIAYEREKLISWYKEQIHEGGWQDGRFHKSFKQGSPIEWCNPLGDIDQQDHLWGHGIFEQWAPTDQIIPWASQRNIEIIK